MSDRPTLLEMIRAPFLIAIIVPLVIGTITAVLIQGEFNTLGFIFALMIGLSLHISTNVYNDIYDTLQGADDSSTKENDYSGGSGVLVNDPELLDKMFLIARTGIIVGVIGGLLLMLIVDRRLWPLLVSILVISIFLSKYYTASPFKLAYRGFGEIAVWIGFGPLAVLLASVGQNLGIYPLIIAIMPITGLSTLFLVWMGEIVDLETDKEAGKRGLVIRLGRKRSLYAFSFIHAFALLNVIYLAIYMMNPGYPLLLAVLPHALLFPKFWSYAKHGTDNPNKLKKASQINFRIFILFSAALMIGFTIDLLTKLIF